MQIADTSFKHYNDYKTQGERKIKLLTCSEPGISPALFRLAQSQQYDQQILDLPKASKQPSKKQSFKKQPSKKQLYKKIFC